MTASGQVRGDFGRNYRPRSLFQGGGNFFHTAMRNDQAPTALPRQQQGALK
jgi:hypothetical protein